MRRADVTLATGSILAAIGGEAIIVGPGDDELGIGILGGAGLLALALLIVITYRHDCKVTTTAARIEDRQGDMLDVNRDQTDVMRQMYWTFRQTGNGARPEHQSSGPQSPPWTTLS